MEKKIWNIGILGLGAAAEKHAEAIMEIPGAKLLSCCSKNMEKRRAWMQKYGCEACINPRDLFLDSRLDIIIVCTPSGMHGENAIYALNTGHHVIVEKPLELTSARCSAIIRNEKSTGKRCFTVFQNRYSDTVQTMKRAIDSGRLGKITMASAYQKWWRDPEYYTKSSWHGTLSLDGGGALMNQGIHALDLLTYLAGGIRSVSAMKSTLFHQAEAEDTIVSALEFESGALGTIECSTCTKPGTERRIEIRGTKGSIIAEDERLVLWSFDEETDQDRLIRERFGKKDGSNRSAEDAMAFPIENHKRQLIDILHSLETGEACMTDSECGRDTVHAVECIYESAETDMRIYL